VKTQVDERLVDEAARFGLRFACEDCAHFAADEGECAHGYPTAPHRRALLRSGGVVTFCKEFDLSAATTGGSAA